MTLPMRVSRGAPLDRIGLIEYFEESGVETRPLIAGNLARHPATAHVVHRTANDLADCDSLLTETLMIGCHPVLSSETLETLEQALIGLRGL
jgi:CDP-6-deoxy-D-xylo-4-hexulose-3-dehydrase